MNTRPILALAVAGATLLAGCEQQVEAPTDRGVCWHMVTVAGKPKFNVLARGQAGLEYCAAELEKMRISFQSLGVPQGDIIGAYQGQFLFINRYGVFTAQALTGYQYPFMVRTGDGRLAMPGAMPQQPGQ
ncbi:MAG TPA: hypothetical protein VGI30_12760 [Caulobacteraceae bacterium]